MDQAFSATAAISPGLRPSSMRLVVVGGNGFVGSAICRAAVGRGLDVTSLSRSGLRPAWTTSHAWAQSVNWERGDALDASSYEEQLAGAGAVVVAVGTPPAPFQDEAWQARMNGETSARVVATAAEQRVPRVVLVGATMPSWLKHVAPGYFRGKQRGEMAAEEFVAVTPSRNAAIVLRPGAVNGTRYLGTTPIPLWIALSPAAWLLTTLSPVVDAAVWLLPGLFKGLLVPPVLVEDIACVAIDAVLDDGRRFEFPVGAATVVDPAQMYNYRRDSPR